MWQIWRVVQILLLFQFCLANDDHENSEDEDEPVKILRVQLEENGLKLVTMSDGEVMVTFQLRPDGKINDCKVMRRRRLGTKKLGCELKRFYIEFSFTSALGMLKYDVDNEAGQEDVVEYLDASELDVQWYSRQCSRFLRHPDISEEIQAKQKVNKEFAGTQFCTRFGSSYHPKFNDGLNPEDECCKLLKGCDNYIPYMHYRHGFLNAHLYDITDCACLSQFQKCLQDLKSDLALELHRIFFDYLNLKCYDLVPHSFCAKYSSPWFEDCVDSVTYLTVNTRNLQF